MLKRIHIKGYKSLVDVEVDLKPLSVLLGPNAAGKSNFLDALQILSKLASSRTLMDAFEPPYRGKPLESFSFGHQGIKGLVQQESLSFSIEADLHLSDAVVNDVNRMVLEMRSTKGDGRSGKMDRISPRVTERDLRYRIEIEMLPGKGVMRLADEYLVALNNAGKPSKNRQPFIEQRNRRIRLRREGYPYPACYGRYLNRSILSMPHHPPHYPHLVAAQHEMESWLFYYFEPRERMRAASPVREVRHIGLMGEELAAFLNTLKTCKPERFETIEKSLRLLVPNVDGIEVEVNDLGDVDLRLRENGISVSSRVISDGTLRMLGLLALTGIETAPALIGLEEPENGVHPRRISLIAELLNCQAALGDTQYVVTSHSPLLPDRMEEDALYVVVSPNGRTRIDPFSAWGPFGRRTDGDRALEDMEPSRLSVSERILRGDLDA